MRASARWTRPTRQASRGVRRSTPKSTTRPARDRSSASRSSGRCSACCPRCVRRSRAARIARSTGSRRSVLLGALLGPAPARRPDGAGGRHRPRCRDHPRRRAGRPACAARARRGVDHRLALPDAATDRRSRAASAHAVRARVPGAGRRGRGLSAGGRGGRHRPVARALG